MKKSIFTLTFLSGLFATQAFAQISLSNDGYAFDGCSNQGSYNLSVQSVKPRPSGRGCKDWCFSTKYLHDS